MTISIKSIGGSFNTPPVITDFRLEKVTCIKAYIKYKVNDLNNQIARHYLNVDGNKEEITKSVGYEQEEFYFVKDGFEPGTTHTIELICTDGIDEVKSQTIQFTTTKVLGFRVDESNSNPNTCVSYIESAVGMTPLSSSAGKKELGKWEKEFPFNKLRIVGVKTSDYKVYKEINKDNMKLYTDGASVETDVDVMLEIPKVYVKITFVDQNVYEVRLCDEPLDDNYKCYAHTFDDSVKDIVDNIYISCYPATNLEITDTSKAIGYSRSGVACYVKPDGTQAGLLHALSKNKSSNHFFMLYQILNLLRHLAVLLFKSLDTKKCIGTGSTKVNYKKTGVLDDKGFIYKGANNSASCFLGLENLFFVDVGCIYDGPEGSRDYGSVGIGYGNTYPPKMRASISMTQISYNFSGFLQKTYKKNPLLVYFVDTPTLSGGSSASETTYYCSEFSIVGYYSYFIKSLFDHHNEDRNLERTDIFTRIIMFGR